MKVLDGQELRMIARFGPPPKVGPEDESAVGVVRRAQASTLEVLDTFEREQARLTANRELEDDEREEETQNRARIALNRLERVERLETGGDVDRMRANLRRHGDHRRRVAELDHEVSALRTLWADVRREIQPHLGWRDPLEVMAGGRRAGGYS